MHHSKPDSKNQVKSSFGFDINNFSMIETLRFLSASYKTILFFGMLGIAISIAYLAFTPKRYEAVAQIATAQIGVTNSNNSNINPIGVNVEEPSLLISRLTSPASFTQEAVAACADEGQANTSLALSKSIKLAIPKGIANVVEIKTFGASPLAAEKCNLAIFELIKTTQSQIVSPYIENAKIKLADDEDRLSKAKDHIAKADKSGSAINASYLSSRDEIRYLLDEITALKNVISSTQTRATRLIAPVYASDIPISPNKRATIAAGLFVGLFFGFLFVLFHKFIVKIKDEMH